MELKENERIDDLEFKGFKIIQNSEGFCFGMDAVLLSDFAKNIKIDSKIKYEWARIPHFYNSFYVYKYATGLGIASYIVKRIRSNDEDFKNKYINLLKSGGRDYPLVLLKECGIDILNDDIVYEALESFNELIDKFE